MTGKTLRKLFLDSEIQKEGSSFGESIAPKMLMVLTWHTRWFLLRIPSGFEAGLKAWYQAVRSYHIPEFVTTISC